MWTTIILVKQTKLWFRCDNDWVKWINESIGSTIKSVKNTKLFVDLANIMVVHIMNNEIGCFNQFVLREQVWWHLYDACMKHGSDDKHILREYRLIMVRRGGLDPFMKVTGRQVHDPWHNLCFFLFKKVWVAWVCNRNNSHCLNSIVKKNCFLTKQGKLWFPLLNKLLSSFNFDSPYPLCCCCMEVLAFVMKGRNLFGEAYEKILSSMFLLTHVIPQVTKLQPSTPPNHRDMKWQKCL